MKIELAHRAREIFWQALDGPADKFESYLAEQAKAQPEIAPLLRELARDHEQLQNKTRTWLSPPSLPAMPTLAREERPRELAVAELIAERYRVVRKLGSGGFSDVYLVDDSVQRRQLALKVLHRSSEAWLSRVRREIALLRHLRMPGIVQLHDDGSEGSITWLAMDYLDAQPFPGSGRRESWEDFKLPLITTLEALERMHRAGVLHCDIKPSNVLVDARGYATLLDLGISRDPGISEASKGPILATPGYMAPELIKGAQHSIATELFSLGSMIWRVAGEQPDMPQDVRSLLRSLINKDPIKRPRSTTAILQVLTKIAPETEAPAPGKQQWSAAEDLRRLFAGHDRIHHIPEDAAELLAASCEHTFASAQRELERWQRSGLGQFEAGLFHIDRLALERLALQASFEVSQAVEDSQTVADAQAVADDAEHSSPTRSNKFHRKIALQLDLEDPARLFHQIASNDAVAARDDATQIALKSLDRDQPARALSMTLEAIAAWRCSQMELPGQLASLLVECAIHIGTSQAFDHVLYELGRSRGSAESFRYECLANAARCALSGDGQRSLDLLRDVNCYPNDRMELVSYSIRALAQRSLQDAQQRSAISQEIEDWASTKSDQRSLSCAASWQGWSAYMDGDYLEAARCHERAGRLAPSQSISIAAALGAAESYIECGSHQRARELACRALALARGLRSSEKEARSELLIRSIDYRLGTAQQADLELCEAVACLGAPNLCGQITLNEAAVAWRSQDKDRARELARRSAAAFRSANAGAGATLADALALLAGCRATDADTVLRDIQDCPLALIAGQALALIARARIPVPHELRSSVLAICQRQLENPKAIRHEVLSDFEILEALEA